ncbi:MAG TPA: DinB family protein [Rhodothermales bacterium]|nr:DinB family protein [Rhodothermales bacterium]
MKTQFINLLRYNHWANTLVLRSISTLPTPNLAANNLFAHILAAQQIWLNRLRQEGPSVAVWPILPLKTLHTWMKISHNDWEACLSFWGEEALNESISYQTTSGESFLNTRAEIITHVLNHGTHHRAQISAQIRATGNTPPAIDYIVFLRSLANH